MGDPQLITSYKFMKQDFLIKLFIKENNRLELSVINKLTKDEWRCYYEASYIESMTQKTGNYKQFHVFITMLRSGLLKTTECISLDLLTFKDLKNLRCHKNRNMAASDKYFSTDIVQEPHKRYLILTYTVEFDKIHYPLPLEYIGPPDPKVQQQIIHKLEAELYHLRQSLQDNTNETNLYKKLKFRNKILQSENTSLKQKIDKISPNNKSRETIILQRALKELERGIIVERDSHHRLVQKLRMDNLRLSNELYRLKKNETLLITKLHNVSKNKNDYCIMNPKFVATNRATHYSRKESLNKKAFNFSRSKSLSPSNNTGQFNKSKFGNHTGQHISKAHSCSSILSSDHSYKISNKSLRRKSAHTNHIISKRAESLSSRNKSSSSQKSLFSSNKNDHCFELSTQKSIKNNCINRTPNMKDRIRNLQTLFPKMS